MSRLPYKSLSAVLVDRLCLNYAEDWDYVAGLWTFCINKLPGEDRRCCILGARAAIKFAVTCKGISATAIGSYVNISCLAEWAPHFVAVVRVYYFISYLALRRERLIIGIIMLWYQDIISLNFVCRLLDCH